MEELQNKIIELEKALQDEQREHRIDLMVMDLAIKKLLEKEELIKTLEAKIQTLSPKK